MMCGKYRERANADGSKCCCQPLAALLAANFAAAVAAENGAPLDYTASWRHIEAACKLHHAMIITVMITVIPLFPDVNSARSAILASTGKCTATPV